MSMFTLAISCLTTSNLPWFMDLTFQVPIQYCSSQQNTLLPSPITSTVGCCFHFGSVSSFFLELFLHWSPVAYWASTYLGSHLSVSYILPFHTVHGVLKAGILKWFAIPFSLLPFSDILSERSTMTCLSWVALQGMAHNFIELDMAVVHVISLFNFLWLRFSFFLSSDG